MLERNTIPSLFLKIHRERNTWSNWLQGSKAQKRGLALLYITSFRSQPSQALAAGPQTTKGPLENPWRPQCFTCTWDSRATCSFEHIVWLLFPEEQVWLPWMMKENRRCWSCFLPLPHHIPIPSLTSQWKSWSSHMPVWGPSKPNAWEPGAVRCWCCLLPYTYLTVKRPNYTLFVYIYIPLSTLWSQAVTQCYFSIRPEESLLGVLMAWRLREGPEIRIVHLWLNLFPFECLPNPSQSLLPFPPCTGQLKHILKWKSTLQTWIL